jgi:hypothetical protein
MAAMAFLLTGDHIDLRHAVSRFHLDISYFQHTPKVVLFAIKLSRTRLQYYLITVS